MTYLTLPGTRLFYEDAGSGDPPLVFIHGVARFHGDWSAQVDFFSPHHRVITCDLRGHGVSTGEPDRCDIETYGDDVRALLDALDLHSAILVGHSMGVRVVLQANLVASRRVAGLVLIEGSRVGTGDPQLAEQTVRRQIQAVGYSAFLRALFEDMFLEGADPAVKERIISEALTLPEPIGGELIPRFIRWDAQSLGTALDHVAVPVLLVQSTYINPQRARAPLEPGTTSPWLDLIQRSVPETRTRIVSGAGHFVMIEQPQAVNQHIAEFVAHQSRSD
jgi:pimeloyl-ACP methyl ester carboxylesterase